MTMADEVEALITRRPGLTEEEIAKVLFGEAATQQKVCKACASLLKSRRIERSGKGGRTDPFRYFPKGTLSVPSSPTKRSKFAV